VEFLDLGRCGEKRVKKFSMFYL